CLDSKPFNHRRLFFVVGSMKNKTKLNVPLPLVVRLIERLPIRPVLTVTAVSVLNRYCGPFRNRRLIALSNQVISLDSRSSVDYRALPQARLVVLIWIVNPDLVKLRRDKIVLSGQFKLNLNPLCVGQ